MARMAAGDMDRRRAAAATGMNCGVSAALVFISCIQALHVSNNNPHGFARVAHVRVYGAVMAAHDLISQSVLIELHRQGLERQQLAARVGVSPSWVTNKLAGRRRWTADDLDALAGALGIPVAWLLMPREVVTDAYRRLLRVVTVKYQTRATRATRLAVAA